jgi:hypothetical protein
MKFSFTVALGLMMAIQVNAQELPPIFRFTPKEIVPARSIAEFPVNTFLENIAVHRKGNLFVTSLEDGRIHRIAPDGTKIEFARIEGKVAGIAFERSGSLLVTGWAGGTKPSIFAFRPAAKSKLWRRLMELFFSTASRDWTATDF